VPMMLAQGGLRDLRKRGLIVMFGAVFTLFSAIIFSAEWDRSGAEKALIEARQLRDLIAHADNPTQDQYKSCVRTFRQVYLKDPHFSGTDDALFAEASLYAEMGERFGKAEYFDTAARRFRYLISDYGSSRWCPDAYLKLIDLYQGPLDDAAGAAAARAVLVTRYKKSKATMLLASRNVIAPEAPQLPPGTTTTARKSTLQNIRYWTTDNYTRIVIDMDQQTAYDPTRLSNPDRIYFDISDAKLGKDLQNRTFMIGGEFIKQVRVAQNEQEKVRVVFDLETAGQYSISELHNPFRIIVDIPGRRGSREPVTRLNPGSAPRPDETLDAASMTVLAPPEKPKLPAQIPLKPTESTLKIAKTDEPESPKPLETKRPLLVHEIEPPPAKESAVPIRLPETKTAEFVAPSPVVSSSAAATVPIVAAEKTSETKAPLIVQGKEATPGKDAKPPARPPTTTSAPNPADKPPLNLPAETKKPEPLPAPKAATPTSSGDRTLTRMLGLKIGRIVIDPGHGGHDTGTIGPGGLLEKDLVLALARDLRALLEEDLNMEVVLTRDDDVFIPLEERTTIANQKRADLFLSLHANHSTNRSISGVETYYLDFARTSAAREIAARENATTLQNISELENLVKKIAQADKSAESKELAAIIQKTLYGSAQKLFPSTKNRGVRSAPFVVLIGANMPSVLAEVAFLSNPRDEKLLKSDTNRTRIAKALFSGIEGYMKTLGSVVAENKSNPN